MNVIVRPGRSSLPARLLTSVQRILMRFHRQHRGRATATPPPRRAGLGVANTVVVLRPFYTAPGTFHGHVRPLAHQEQRLLALVAELSTPVIPVLAGVLVLPLVGTIDSRRAQQITAQVLDCVERERATTIIIDITGVVTVTATPSARPHV